MKIFTANPKKEFNEYQQEIEDKVLDVLRSGNYILGINLKFLKIHLKNI